MRFHYSLVFDLSPTLRQIASIPLFFVTRNAKQFLLYFVKQWHRIDPNTYIFMICVTIAYFWKQMEHHRAIVISLFYKLRKFLQQPPWRNGYGARLRSKGFRIRLALRATDVFVKHFSNEVSNEELFDIYLYWYLLLIANKNFYISS